MIYLKSPEDIIKMREAGRVVARALAEIKAALKPGVSTWELDQIAAKVFQQHGAKPAFLNYPPNSPHPFPATITASINSEVIHGIPSKDRILHEGDIVSIDTGCHYQGFVGDAAFSAGVGTISAAAQKLLDVTEQALYVGIQASIAGNETRDVAKAVQTYVEAHGCNVVREFTGHGVGRKMHEEPDIHNWWPTERRLARRFHSVKLRTGMTYAIEPMVSMGRGETFIDADHWTVITQDGSLSAHFEHTIAVVEAEPLILTLP